MTAWRPRRTAFARATAAAFAALSAATLVATFATSAAAQSFYARHGMTGPQYQAAFDQYTGQGYRLAQVDVAATPNGMRYAAIWRRGGPRFVARHGMSGGQYQAAFDQYTGQGYRLVEVSAGGLASPGRFAAIWSQGGSGRWAARHGMTSAQYQAAFNQYTGQGYRLIDVDGYTTPSGVRYAALWVARGSSRWVARHGMTSAQYQAAFDQYTGQGYAPRLVDCYWTPSGVRYAAIWAQGGGRWIARHGMTSASYQGRFNEHVGAGYSLHHVSGCWDGGQMRYAAIWRR